MRPAVGLLLFYKEKSEEKNMKKYKLQWLELDTLGSPLACYHVTNESDYISWYDFTKKSTVRLDGRRKSCQ